MARREANLVTLLATLESRTSKGDDKIEVYEILCSNLKEDELSLFNEDVSKQSKRVLTLIRRDLATEGDSVLQGALQVLGFCVHDVDIARGMPVAEVSGIIDDICNCVKRTIDKTTCTRALWCLSRQNFQPHLLATKLEAILETVGHALEQWRGQSVTVEYEAVTTVARLQDQCFTDLEKLTCQWAKLMYPLLTHSAPKIREMALDVLQKGIKQLLEIDSAVFTSTLISDLKSKHLSELKKLFLAKNEVYGLTVWCLLVQILGKELHHGSLINHVLPVAELGFKSSSVQVKTKAFDAWKCLIDNFSQNPAILGDAKRVKLIMQVFKINNAKVESVAEKKLSVWWHFIQKLDAKVSVYFDQVCVPLLQMCVGSVKIGAAQNLTTPTFSRVGMLNVGASPATPRLNLTNHGSQLTTFPAIQVKGCEILAHFLGKLPDNLDIPKVLYSVDPLSAEVMTGPSFFVKQASTILPCTKELLMAQGKTIQDGLLYHIWYALVAHVKNVVESGAKSESREVLTNFLNCFQLIVLTDVMENSRLLKLFQAVCCLPRKALCSTAYQMGGGEVLHGTPVLFLTELLLTPKMMENCAVSEKLMSLFGMLVEIGMSHGGVLEFSQHILHVLARLDQVVQSDQLWRMWSMVVNPLQEHIKKTNEVNQGDVLEHDFTCMYTALIFPINKLLPGRLSQGTVKTLLKTWSELYSTFSRLSSMVTNAEANVSCEQLTHRILSAVDFNQIQENSYLDALTHMLEAIIGQVDFSSLGAPRPFTATLSPSRWMKRKQKPLENIHSFILVLCKTMTAFTELSSLVNLKSKNVSSTSMQSTASCIVGILTMLFSHVTSSQIITSQIDELAEPTAMLFQSAAAKSFTASFQQKLEKLWLDISTCLQSRYTGGFDSDFLAQLSPLLEATFSHTRRQIKTQTMLLWNATFGKSPPLKYPENLRPVLTKVLEKTNLMLPGWISTDIPIVEETPLSQFSQIGSSAPEPQLPGMPSPHKIRGSFLNKAVSPNIKKSPAKSLNNSKPNNHKNSPIASKAKKNLSLFEMRDKDFVVIVPSPKQKFVLTDHQKEVLKERRSLPAMYNNLELSQDVSLSSQFMTDTQPQPSSQSDSVILLDSESELIKPPPPPVDKTRTSTDKMDESQPPTKRRRSIRFSDEVFEKPTVNEKDVSVNQSVHSTQKSESKKEDENDVKISDSREDKIAEDDKKSKNGSSSFEDVTLSVKPNLQHAMGVVLSETPSVSTGKLTSSSDDDKVFEESEVEENLLKSDLSGKIDSSSSRNASVSQLFFCTEDSQSRCSLTSVPMTTVNMDSIVEDTQDMFSPPKSEPSPKHDSVMETPVKSTEDGIVTTTTPTSRALFENKQTLDDKTNYVPTQSSHPFVKSPVIKIQRLSGDDILQYSPHRRRNSDDDVVFSSQPEQPSGLLIKAAKVRRSLSHPQSGRFGGEVLQPLETTKSSSLENKTASDSIPESPEANLSQGFVPINPSLENETGFANKLSNILEEIGEPMEEDTSIVDSGKITQPFLSLTPKPTFVPDIAGSTLKSSSDLEPIPEISGDESDSESVQSSTNSRMSTRSSQGHQDSDNSFNPDLKSTLVSSVDTRARRKSHVPLKSKELINDKRSKRRSLPTPATETEVHAVKTRLSQKESSQREATPIKNKTSNSKVSSDLVTDSTNKPKSVKPAIKTRRSCLGAIENTDSTSKVVLSTNSTGNEPAEAGVAASVDKSLTTPSRGKKRGRNSKEICHSQDSHVGFAAMSVDELEITFKTDDLTEKLIEKTGILSVSPDKTPDSREIIQKEPQRQSTSKVKREQLKAAGSNPRLNTPRARKSLTIVDPFESDSDENVPLSSIASQKSSQSQRFESETTTETDFKNATSGPGETESGMVDVNDAKNSNISENEKVISKVDLSEKSNKDTEIENEQMSEEDDLLLTPSRQGPPKYKVAKLSPMTKRLRSAQKETSRDKADDYTESPKSASKGKRLSLTRKKLNVEMEDKKESAVETPVSKLDSLTERDSIFKSMSSEKHNLTENFPLSKIETLEKSIPERESKNKCQQSAVSNASKEDSNSNVLSTEKGPSVDHNDEANNASKNDSVACGKSANDKKEKFLEKTKENLLQEKSEKVAKNKNFTEILSPEKKSTRVRFGENLIFGETDGPQTPKSNPTVHTTMAQSDSKLHGPKRLNFPLGEREMCKTSPRGILKRTSVSKAMGGFSRTRSFHNPWSPRGLHIKKIHPVTVPRLYSPSASPSASILKRRRLSEDIAANSPSPPSKQRRVSFAEPVSDANAVVTDVLQNTFVSRCLELPTQSYSPASSQSKKYIVASQSQSSCLSTQESQLNCTEPVYPQLQKCNKPVETLLPQLTSSIWSRGLEQLVRARNIRTVGDLCNLSEYEVHNLPIRSPKVPTLRKVLRQFESRSEKKSVSNLTENPSTAMSIQKHKPEAIESFTTPGSPSKDESTTKPETNQSKALIRETMSVIGRKETSVSSNLIGFKPVSMEAKCSTLIGNQVNSMETDSSDLIGGKLNDENYEDDILPAVEDALSELSPIKDLNASIDVLDDESERIERIVDSDKDTNSNGSTNHAEFLKTIEEYSEVFNSDNMHQFSARDILQLHGHLTKLLNSAVTALGPKCRSPNSQ